MKKFWAGLMTVLGLIVGAIVGYSIVKKNKDIFVERAIEKVAPIAPAMEITEYREKVKEKSQELAKAEVVTIMDQWVERFGGNK